MTPPAHRLHTSGHPASVLITYGAAAVAVAAFSFASVSHPALSSRTSGCGPPSARCGVSGQIARAFSPAWSPDGRRIAFLQITGTGLDAAMAIHVMSSAGGQARRLTPLRRFDAPTWSPDGSQIAFGGGGIHVVNRDGSGKRQLSRQGRSPDWGPRGRKIAFSADGIIRVMNRDGSSSEIAAAPNYLYTYESPTWSPGGEKLAFFADHAQDSVQPRYLGAIDKLRGSVKRLLGGEARTPDWSPGGRMILFSRSGGFSDPASSLYVLDLETRRVKRLHRGYTGRWSPDGRRIVFADVGSSDVDKASYIFVMNADGSDVRQLTR